MSEIEKTKNYAVIIDNTPHIVEAKHIVEAAARLEKLYNVKISVKDVYSLDDVKDVYIFD